MQISVAELQMILPLLENNHQDWRKSSVAVCEFSQEYSRVRRDLSLLFSLSLWVSVAWELWLIYLLDEEEVLTRIDEKEQHPP